MFKFEKGIRKLYKNDYQNLVFFYFDILLEKIYILNIYIDGRVNYILLNRMKYFRMKVLKVL